MKANEEEIRALRNRDKEEEESGEVKFQASYVCGINIFSHDSVIETHTF